MKAPRARVVGVVAAFVATSIVVARLSRHVVSGHAVPGGVLMGDAGRYDIVSRLVFGPLFRRIAADVAASASADARILEVGCGPGLLSIELASAHDLDVTGLDLDPAMIERAESNAPGPLAVGARQPAFVVADVAALPFDDGSFDRVISTFSMHHWSDKTRGMEEIARVLAPGGRALIWDLKPGALPFHPTVHDEGEAAPPSSLTMANVDDWRWPGRLIFARRIELVNV